MSDCSNAHLSAYDRAEIEDAERNTKAAQTVQGCVDDEIVYGFQFCDVPSSTMLGETMFDYNGEPVGWIVANGVKGTCEMEWVSDWMGWHCKACDSLRLGLPDQKPNFCPNCGAKVRKKMDE